MASTFEPTPTLPADHGPVISATRARSARWGRHKFWVLLASTILAVAVLFGAWAFKFGDANESYTGTSRDEAAMFQTPSPPTPAARPASR